MAPGHEIGPGEDRREGAQEGHEAPEENNLAAMPAKQVLAQLEPALIESAIFRQSDPERAAKARQRFRVAAEAVARALDGTDYLVAGRFGVADVLVGTALAFTARAGFAEELPPSLKDYVARLMKRPAYQRAAERTSLSLAG